MFVANTRAAREGLVRTLTKTRDNGPAHLAHVARRFGQRRAYYLVFMQAEKHPPHPVLDPHPPRIVMADRFAPAWMIDRVAAADTFLARSPDHARLSARRRAVAERLADGEVFFGLESDGNLVYSHWIGHENTARHNRYVDADRFGVDFRTRPLLYDGHTPEPLRGNGLMRRGIAATLNRLAASGAQGACGFVRVENTASLRVVLRFGTIHRLIRVTDFVAWKAYQVRAVARDPSPEPCAAHRKAS